MSLPRWLKAGMGLVVVLPLVAGAGGRAVWNFESDEPGKTPTGLSVDSGAWEVVQDGGNRVLFQKAKSEDAAFNVVMARETRGKDVDLSVRLKPIAGEVDRGGGLIWRARDKQNYYLCRFNPLEDNFRVFKVVNGVRKQLKSAKVPEGDAWHTLRATMTGAKIACYLDGKKLLEAEDATFPDAGMIGLWSKADAQTYFDDLSVSD